MRYIAVLLVVVIFFKSTLSIAEEEKVSLNIKGSATVASTDESFVCVCIDFWPQEKCDFDWCPWGQSSALNLDLNHPVLYNALEAFSVDPNNSSERSMPPLRARIGGSLQDQVIYKVGSRSDHPPCPRFRKKEGLTFGFSHGCLTMYRWDEINDLFHRAGVVLTFGLNAMLGRKPSTKPAPENKAPLYEGPWDSSNAKAFINYTVSKGFNVVDTWEFGNELSGDGVGWRADADTYGNDLIVLKKIIEELYHDRPSKPRLVAPGGFYHHDWFSRMLKVSGPDVVNVVSHHIYNLGPGNTGDLFQKLQDPDVLSRIDEDFKRLEEETIKKNGPWSSAWVGESGGAHTSGGPESHTFVNSFWYLDQLGMSTIRNTKVYCRQTLVGGNYQLINRDTFVPYPDYYSALLWHRLMGTGVLEASHNGSKYLRAYSHCGRSNDTATLLLINLSNSTSFDVSVHNGAPGVEPGTEREDYYLTPKDGNLRSTVMLLNGSPLELTNSGQIPEMKPTKTKANAPILIVPSSIAFIQFKDFGASACFKK